MTDVLERLRAVNPVPSAVAYRDDEVARRVEAILLGRRPRRAPALAAAAAVIATAGLAIGAAMLVRPSAPAPSADGGSYVPEVTVQCRATYVSGTQFDRLTDVVADRWIAAGINHGYGSNPLDGYVDVTVPTTQAALARSACRPTTVAVRGAVTLRASAITAADALPPGAGRPEWAVRVTFTPAAAATLRAHAHERVEFVLDGTVLTRALPTPDRAGAVELTGGYDQARAAQLADGIEGAAFGLAPAR